MVSAPGGDRVSHAESVITRPAMVSPAREEVLVEIVRRRISIVAVLGCLLTSCVGAELGEAALVVQALSAADVARVAVTIEGPGVAPPIEHDLVRAGMQWQGAIGGIPVGVGRTVTASAYDTAGIEIFRGVASDVEIRRGETITLAIVLQQVTPPDRARNDPPRITAALVAPGVLAPSEVATVSVQASDPDPGDTLTYEWAADGGSFGDAASASTSWTAPMTEGDYELTVTVRDRAGARRSVHLSVPVRASRGRGTARIRASFNTWPEVARFVVDPGLVPLGASADLVVEASDADGDSVTHSFTDDCGGSVTGLVWTAPSAAPPTGACTVTLRAEDGRGGEAYADALVYVGDEIAGNHAPVIDATFQSRWEASAGDIAHLEVTANDVDGDALAFTWTASSGTLGVAADTASSSANTWISTGASATVTARATDPGGAFAEAVFEITATGPVPSGCNGLDDDGDTLIDELGPAGPWTWLPGGEPIRYVVPSVWTGAEVLAVHPTLVGGNYDLALQRIGADGTPLAPTRTLFADAHNQTAPSITWNGTQLAVAWIDDRAGHNEAWFAAYDSSGAAVVAPRRVSTPGQAVNPGALASTNGAHVAWSGTHYLVAWHVEGVGAWTLVLTSDGGVARAAELVPGTTAGINGIAGNAEGFLLVMRPWHMRVNRFDRAGTYLGFDESATPVRYWARAFEGPAGLYTAYLEATPGGGFWVQRWSPATGPSAPAAFVPTLIESNIADGIGIAAGPDFIFFSWGSAIAARRTSDLSDLSGAHLFGSAEPSALVHTDRGVVVILQGLEVGLVDCF